MVQWTLGRKYFLISSFLQISAQEWNCRITRLPSFKSLTVSLICLYNVGWWCWSTFSLPWIFTLETRSISFKEVETQLKKLRSSWLPCFLPCGKARLKLEMKQADSWKRCKMTRETWWRSEFLFYSLERISCTFAFPVVKLCRPSFDSAHQQIIAFA